jgi:hypothetical protein
LSLPTRAAVLAAAAVVAAPLALLYDLMLSAVAAAWLVRDRASAAAWTGEAALLACLYLVLLLGIGMAERFYLPVFPLAAFAVFALAARRAWKETRLRRQAELSGALRQSNLDERREIASVRSQ